MLENIQFPAISERMFLVCQRIKVTWETLVLYLIIQTKNRSSEVEKKSATYFFFQHHLFKMSVFTYLVVLCRCLKQDKKIRHIFHLISQPINLYSIRLITRSFFLCRIKMLESVPKKIILSSAANIALFILFGIYFINIFQILCRYNEM